MLKRDEVVKKLETKNRKLHDITAKQAEYIEALEGYTRVENLLVYELTETYAEIGLARWWSTADCSIGGGFNQSEATFLHFCKMELKVTINKQDISICHRLRKSSPTDACARPKIVRFSNRGARPEVLAAKANLNKSNSTASAVQLETNLQVHHSDNLHFRKLKRY